MDQERWLNSAERVCVALGDFIPKTRDEAIGPISLAAEVDPESTVRLTDLGIMIEFVDGSQLVMDFVGRDRWLARSKTSLH